MNKKGASSIIGLMNVSRRIITITPVIHHIKNVRIVTGIAMIGLITLLTKNRLRARPTARITTKAAIKHVMGM